MAEYTDWNALRNGGGAPASNAFMGGDFLPDYSAMASWGAAPDLSPMSNAGIDFNLPDVGGRMPNFMDSLRGAFTPNSILGSTNTATGMKTPGWGSLALGTGQALLSGYMGMKQYGLGKKTLEQNKRQFDLNFGAQQKTINSRMEDRQKARVASNPGAYESVSDYMKKNGI